MNQPQILNPNMDCIHLDHLNSSKKKSRENKIRNKTIKGLKVIIAIPDRTHHGINSHRASGHMALRTRSATTAQMAAGDSTGGCHD
jgi:hypothetical protein